MGKQKDKHILFLDNQIWKEKEFEKILSDNFQIIKPDF